MEDNKERPQDKPSIHKSAAAINNYIRKMILEEFSRFTTVIEKRLETFNSAIDIYSRITKDIEKRQIALESKVSASIETIKFFFGGGCILTLINIVIAIIMVITSKS